MTLYTEISDYLQCQRCMGLVERVYVQRIITRIEERGDWGHVEVVGREFGFVSLHTYGHNHIIPEIHRIVGLRAKLEITHHPASTTCVEGWTAETHSWFSVRVTEE